MQTSSLRVRLVGATLAAIFLGWAAWFGSQLLRHSGEQNGWWDDALQSVGQQLILSLPADVGTLAADLGVASSAGSAASSAGSALPSARSVLPSDQMLALPAAMPFAGDLLSFQVWTNNPPRLMLRSPGAPATPLRGDPGQGFAQRDAGGQVWRVYSISDAQGRVTVHVGKPVAQLDDKLLAYASGSLITGIGLFALLAAVIWLVIGRSLRPVTAIQEAITDRGALELEPLPLDGLPDEWRPLVASFNRLLARVEQSLQAERRFVADAAHELRTPLAALLGQIEIAQRAARDGDHAGVDRGLAALAEVAARGTRLSEQLLDMARLDAGSDVRAHGPVALHELLAWIVHEFRDRVAARHQQLVLNVTAVLVHGDLDELGILVRNLVDNALRYTPDGGSITVSCRHETRGQASIAQLCVADDGPGVDAAEHALITERFYRSAATAGSTTGSGIGLALVSRIAASHHATLTFERGIGGRGLAVQVSLAASEPADHNQRSLRNRQISKPHDTAIVSSASG